ncbi:MAG: hypothetical protein LBT29_02925 [Flavobacteriaceae bacterium]|jgi:hypothetical protein|nr:hypothetical protein [Flavobacteriaceae bacterium]
MQKNNWIYPNNGSISLGTAELPIIFTKPDFLFRFSIAWILITPLFYFFFLTNIAHEDTPNHQSTKQQLDYQSIQYFFSG